MQVDNYNHYLGMINFQEKNQHVKTGSHFICV